MINAKYPILNTNETIDIEISNVKNDQYSDNNDKYCTCTLKGPGISEKFSVYGIDGLQCTYLTFEEIKRRLEKYQERNNLKLEYTFYV